MASTKARISKLENQSNAADQNQIEIVLFMPSGDPLRPVCVHDRNGERFLTQAEYDAMQDALRHDGVVIVRPRVDDDITPA